jgi:hypothetical protein
MRQKTNKWQPEAWQWDPERLTDDRIQVWRGGSFLTIPLSQAKQLVAEKTCFVSTPYMIVVYGYQERRYGQKKRVNKKERVNEI